MILSRRKHELEYLDLVFLYKIINHLTYIDQSTLGPRPKLSASAIARAEAEAIDRSSRGPQIYQQLMLTVMCYPHLIKSSSSSSASPIIARSGITGSETNNLIRFVIPYAKTLTYIVFYKSMQNVERFK